MQHTGGTMNNKWLTIILVIAVLYIVSMGISFFYDGNHEGNTIAVIPISGPIMYEESGSLFGGGSSATPDTIVSFINSANKNPDVKGIILDINSPGGTVLASKEIANAVKKSDKPVIAVIHEVGASGAYWIASASDYIIADELSITGSIGVIGSYLEFSDLFDKYGITYERLVGGKYKDAGSPYTDLTPEERKLLQAKIDLIHEAFIKEVATNRNMSVSDVRKSATGIFYLGSEAKDLGLIDELGNNDNALAKMKELTNSTELTFVTYKHEPSLLDYFNVMTNANAYAFGEGFAHEMAKVSLNNNLQVRAQ